MFYISGLDTQIQEIKESVELPLTHPEYYEEMGVYWNILIIYQINISFDLSVWCGR